MLSERQTCQLEQKWEVAHNGAGVRLAILREAAEQVSASPFAELLCDRDRRGEAGKSLGLPPD